jgi:hypothetical protein
MSRRYRPPDRFLEDRAHILRIHDLIHAEPFFIRDVTDVDRTWSNMRLPNPLN